MPQPCEETAGFLFKHPCRSEAPGSCAECSKAICSKHTKQVGEFSVCVACAKLMLEEKQAKEAGGTTPRERYGSYRNDPYFYGVSHYDGYGSYRRGHWGHEHYSGLDDDGADFTEADGEAFAVEADEGFERDMGGS